MKIRSYILIITSLMGMLACSEKTITPDSPEKGMPINIGTVSTRALVNGIEDINEFGVSIAISNNEENSDYASILHNERVYPNSTRTEWNYVNTRYWLNDRRFYFVASYPYSQDGTGAGSFTMQEFQEGDINGILYQLPVNTYDESKSSKNAGVDVLTATSHVNTSGEYDQTVKINLRHLLTKINLKITQDTDSDPENDYYITKVSLIGIETEGIYMVIPSDDGFVTEWVYNNEVTQSFEKSFDGNTSLRVQKELSVWEEEEAGALLLIPQPIRNMSVKLRIEYNYLLKVDGSSEGKWLNNRYVEEYLPASADLWQSNKHITYKLSFAEPTNIRFYPPMINEWQAPVTGGSIIIK